MGPGIADEQFGESWCVASSMADAVVPHLASRVQQGVDVVFLDTGYHFAETIGRGTRWRRRCQ